MKYIRNSHEKLKCDFTCNSLEICMNFARSSCEVHPNFVCSSYEVSVKLWLWHFTWNSYEMSLQVHRTYVIRSISSLIKICKRCKPKVGNDILLHLHAYEVIQRYNVFVLLSEFAYTMFSNCYSRLGQHLFSGPSPVRIKSQIYSILKKRVLVSHKDLMSSWSQSCKIMARYLQNYIRSCHNFAHVMTAPWYIKKYQIKIIKRLNVKHSSDYDNVWTTSLKEISPLIISPLTLILNQSFSNVIFFQIN